MKSLVLDVTIIFCLTGILLFAEVDSSAVLTLIGLYVGARVASIREAGDDDDDPPAGAAKAPTLPGVVGALFGGLLALRGHLPRLVAVAAAAALFLVAAGCPSTARPVLEQTAALLRDRQHALAQAYAVELEACLGEASVAEVEACDAEVERAYAGPWQAYTTAQGAWRDADELSEQGEDEAAVARALEAQAHAARAVAP